MKPALFPSSRVPCPSDRRLLPRPQPGRERKQAHPKRPPLFPSSDSHGNACPRSVLSPTVPAVTQSGSHHKPSCCLRGPGPEKALCPRGQPPSLLWKQVGGSLPRLGSYKGPCRRGSPCETGSRLSFPPSERELTEKPCDCVGFYYWHAWACGGAGANGSAPLGQPLVSRRESASSAQEARGWGQAGPDTARVFGEDAAAPISSAR